MAILGKIGQALGQIGRFYTSPEGLQNLQATFQDMANPGGGAFQSLQERRMKLAQQQRQQEAIQGLLGQIQPDTYTPQVNELIGEANMAGRGRFDPMAQMTPKGSSFDFTSPQGQAALMNALGAGVSVDGISALRDFLSPKRNTTKLGEGDALYDDDGNLIAQGRVKPPAPERPLVVPEGGTLFWPGQPGTPLSPAYKVPKTYAPPKAPSSAGVKGAPKGGPKRVLTL